MTESHNPLIRYFAVGHLSLTLAQASYPFLRMARTLDARLSNGPEKTVALRKLLEAKDAAVRSALDVESLWNPLLGDWVMGQVPHPDERNLCPTVTGWFRGYLDDGVYAQLDSPDGDIRTVRAITLEPAA